MRYELAIPEHDVGEEVVLGEVRRAGSWMSAAPFAGKEKDAKTKNGVRTVPIGPALVPFLERLVMGRQRTDLVVPALSDFGEDHLAQLFRKHLAAAKVTRVELHESTRTHVESKFRSCRDSGSTWLRRRDRRREDPAAGWIRHGQRRRWAT